MADRDRDAALAQPLDDIAFGDVRALHLVAEIVHHLGDAGHADAADADEVDRADIGARRLLMRRLPPPELRRGRAASAPRPTASGDDAAADRARPGRRGRAPRSAGRPTRARAAALASASGSIASAWICLASSSGVNAACGIVRAPPAFDHLARVRGLVIVGRGRKGTRIAGRPAAVSSAMVDAPARAMTRCASAELRRHVLEIGRELGRDAELGIVRADLARYPRAGIAASTCSRRRSDGGEQAEPVGHDLGEDRRALAAAGDQDAKGAVLVERREGLVAQRQHLLAHRIADEMALSRDASA